VETILELIALMALSVASGFVGYHLAGRSVRQTQVLAAVGLVLVAWPILVTLFPDRLYFLYPAVEHGHIIFATAFLFVGVLFKSYMDHSRRRILNAVLLVVLTYSVFADPVHLALEGDEIRALDGGVRDGVSIQATHYTCMPSATATVMRLWGVEAKEGELAYAMRTGFQGTHATRVPAVVRRYGAARGLDAHIESLSLQELRARGLPAVVGGYDGGIRHAIALLELDETHVVIGDPLRGRRRFSLEEWQKSFRFNGEAIVIDSRLPGVRPRLDASPRK